MYLNYCRGLRFEEAPDYMYLRQLYRSVILHFIFAIIIPVKTRRVKTGLYQDLVINDPGSSVKSEDVILKIFFYLSDLIIYATDARKTIVRI